MKFPTMITDYTSKMTILQYFSNESFQNCLIENTRKTWIFQKNIYFSQKHTVYLTKFHSTIEFILCSCVKLKDSTIRITHVHRTRNNN